MKLFKVSSIRLRLILVLGVIALVGSSLAGGVLFKALSYNISHQEITELTGKVELISSLAALQEHPLDVTAFTKSIDNLLKGHEYLEAWVIEPDGTVVYGNSFPLSLNAEPTGRFVISMSDGRRLRALSTELNTKAPENLRLIVAVDTGPGDKLLYGFGTALLMVCLAWIICVSLFAAWAVRRSLSSIDHFSEQAARIGPEDLSIRLPVENIDIELQKLSTAFNRTLDRVQEAYRRMEGFNADVAHELRTPLANLISGSEVVLSRPRTVEELQTTMASNLEELELLQLMINDMLFLARADSGAMAVDLSETSVRREVTKVLDYYEAMLEDGGLSFEIVGDAKVWANAGLIRRAISNLISNAIKATRPGERITVGIHSIEGFAHVEVHNVGDGIPEEIAPQIFDRFFRADSSRSKWPEGHGLGLAIVRAIACMHGGGTFARSGDKWSEVGFYIRSKREQ